MNAPIGRNASVTVMVSAICASVLLNSLAIAVSANTTRKKSKASRVQPRKLASTAARWPRGVARATDEGVIASGVVMREYVKNRLGPERDGGRCARYSLPNEKVFARPPRG